jgi:hypothetical protein
VGSILSPFGPLGGENPGSLGIESPGQLARPHISPRLQTFLALGSHFVREERGIYVILVSTGAVS